MNATFVILVVVFILAVAIIGAIASAKRRKALGAWAAANGLRFDASHDHSFDERYPLFDCLRQGSNRYAHNVSAGEWNGRPIVAFDYHYETYSHDKNGRKTHHHHFSAVILHSRYVLRPLFIRPEGFLDKVTEFFGFDDIDLESAEFSRKFYVKSPDKKWAYDVLHHRTMQFLLDQPRFTIQFAVGHVIAHRGSRFKVEEFDAAARTIEGMLDGFPDYLKKQLAEGH